MPFDETGWWTVGWFVIDGSWTELPGAAWFALAWLFLLGATLGSFLNVVVYRLPTGQSLMHPGSRCPRCQRPIRWYDNVPILGWFLLRGRCRDCRATISSRYPAVELTLALIFLLLAYVELLSGGANLPRQQGTGAEPFVGQFLRDPAVWATFALHTLLMGGLLAATLIRYDGHAVPRALSLTVLAGCLVLTTVWPQTRPTVSEGWPRAIVVEGSVWSTLIESFLNLAVVGVLMLSARRLWPAGRHRAAEWQSALIALAWVAVALGWPATMALAVATATFYLASHLLVSFWSKIGRVPWTGWLTGCTLVWLCSWRELSTVLPVWGAAADIMSLVASIVLILCVTYATRRFAVAP